MFHRNLDATTRTVFKENLRLSTSLHVYEKAHNQLETERNELIERNAQLRTADEDNGDMLKAKVVEAKRAKDKVRGVSLYENARQT